VEVVGGHSALLLPPTPRRKLHNYYEFNSNFIFQGKTSDSVHLRSMLILSSYLSIVSKMTSCF